MESLLSIDEFDEPFPPRNSVPKSEKSHLGSGIESDQSAPLGSALAPVRLNRNLLALDLGTKTGWAIATRGGQRICGTENFTPGKNWDAGQRGLRFRQWLGQLCDQYSINALTYEEVHRHTGTDAAHLYGLFEGLMYMSASPRLIRVSCVGVGVVKKTFTGWGDASKEGMTDEAKRRGFRPKTDNESDALGILDVALIAETGGAMRLGTVGMPDPKTVKRRPRDRKPRGDLL